MEDLCLFQCYRELPMIDPNLDKPEMTKKQKTKVKKQETNHKIQITKLK